MIVNAALKEAMDENNQEWKTNVLNSISIQETEVSMAITGNHALKIKMIDPGVVPDKIEVIMGKK